MLLVFYGFRSFKIRSFSTKELGISQPGDLDYSIEARQQYFHLFHIPFFSLGKIWAIRKNDELLEIPAEYESAIQPLQTQIKTPWYTYSGLFLLLIVYLCYKGNLKYKRYVNRQESIAYFNEQKTALDEKLNHLTTKDIITMHEPGKEYSSDPFLYLKVEDIQNDVITVTPILSTTKNELEIEQEYTKYINSTPSIKVSLKQLLLAYPKEYDSSNYYPLGRLAVDLLGNNKKYIVDDVVRHFGPNIIDHNTGSFGHVIMMYLYNPGWPATITAIKTLQGDVDWSENINRKFPGNLNNNHFTLYGRNYKMGDLYKFVITLTDTTGQIYKYEVEGRDNEKTWRLLPKDGSLKYIIKKDLIH